MGAVVLVEPNPGGHRFQYVRHLVRASSEAVLLTSAAAVDTAEFETYLGGENVETLTPFDSFAPPTRVLAAEIASLARTRDVEAVVLMDADQALKRWWLDAPREFRRVSTMPRVIFLLTRYPARLSPGDRLGWMHRVSKGSLTVAARARGCLARAVTLAGRDETAPGRIVTRVPDPAICLSSAADRPELRRQLDLPDAMTIVGILGTISGRKNVPLIAAAVREVGANTRLLVAGKLEPEVRDWYDALSSAERESILLRDDYLTNERLDSFVAACNIVSIAQDNNGPSGIMGKALVAGVPVLTAGSKVRARELAAAGPGAGRNSDLSVQSTADGIRALTRQAERATVSRHTTAATPERFAAGVLGLTDR